MKIELYKWYKISEVKPPELNGTYEGLYLVVAKLSELSASEQIPSEHSYREIGDQEDYVPFCHAVECWETTHEFYVSSTGFEGISGGHCAFRIRKPTHWMLIELPKEHGGLEPYKRTKKYLGWE